MRKAVVGFLIGAVIAGVVVYFIVAPGPGPEKRPDSVMIHVVRNGKTPTEIFVTPPFWGICGPKKNEMGGRPCNATELRWRLAGQLQQGETLTIDNASEEECFTARMPIIIPYEDQGDPDDVFLSGLPDTACTTHDYGTYWPYLLTLTFDGGEVTSDPGGIIHP